MTRSMKMAVGFFAVVAPLLHFVSDLMEWIAAGYSSPQLLINYVGFLMMPFIFIGLYAVQIPRVSIGVLVAAILYGSAFVYFGHTTLYALQENIADYEALWFRLGRVYTIHGILMVVSGLLFAILSFGRGVLNRTGLAIFILGITMNLVIAFLPVGDLVQIVGSSIRNLGLVIIGIGLILEKSPDV